MLAGTFAHMLLLLVARSFRIGGSLSTLLHALLLVSLAAVPKSMLLLLVTFVACLLVSGC